MNPTNITSVPGHSRGKLQGLLRSEGLGGLFRRLIHRIKLGVHLRDAYVLAVSYENLNELPAPPIDVEIMELIQPTDSELATLAEFKFHTNSREDVLRYLSEGQHCFVARHQGRIVASFWTLTKEFYDFRNQRSIQLAENEAYALGAFTIPEYRGKGILGYLYACALHDFHRNSPDLRTIVFVDVKNHSSLKLTSKIGFKEIGRTGYLEVLGVRFKYLLGRNALPNTKRRFLISL